MERISIHVCFWNPDGKSPMEGPDGLIEVEVNERGTVGDFKGAIKEESLKREQLKGYFLQNGPKILIMHKNNPLDNDEKTLKEVGIRYRDVIHVCYDSNP